MLGWLAARAGSYHGGPDAACRAQFDASDTGSLTRFIGIKTASSSTDQSIAVFDDASGTPVSRYVHVDHLDRPLMMTNPGGASVWRAIYRPFGEVHQIIGAATLDYRFPGQWFMLETGPHNNWHRWYDTSTGVTYSPTRSACRMGRAGMLMR